MQISRQKTAELTKEANMNATELTATERDSGRLEKQKVKLEKQVKQLKEEKTQLKKQVVGDGKIVVNEKIYTRQQEELVSYRKERDRKVRQLERETAAAKSKELATAESQINSDLTVSIGKLKSQLEKADAIKKILTVKVKKLSAENKQLQQKQESGIYVRQDVYKRQQAQLAAVKRQKSAERVKQKNAEDMAKPAAKRELDGLRRQLAIHVDGLMSMDGEAQAMEAQFDGADGEAAPSADFLDELEGL